MSFRNTSNQIFQHLESVTMHAHVVQEGALSMEEEDDPENNSSTYFQFLRDLRQEFMSGKSEHDALEAVRRKFEAREAGVSTSSNPSASSHWFAKFRDHDRGRKLADAILNKKEQSSLAKPMEEAPQHDIMLEDVQMMFTRGLEAQQNGKYRESFSMMRPCLAFWSNSLLVWLRLSESIMLEYYEESFMFVDIYNRLFQSYEKAYVLSQRRQINDQRPRDNDMHLEFGENAARVAFTLAQHSSKDMINYIAARNYTFLMLKKRRYNDANDSLRWIMRRAESMTLSPSQMAILWLYKCEILMTQNKHVRAMELAMKILEYEDVNARIKQRAQMVVVMGYIRNDEYVKAYDHLIAVLAVFRLDDAMIENVVLLGIRLSHKMKSNTMLKQFFDLLREAVY